MALDAAGLAAAITSEQGPAGNTGIQDDANLKMATAIVNYFKAHAEIACTIPPASINTAGSPAAQVGPPSPVSISGTLS